MEEKIDRIILKSKPWLKKIGVCWGKLRLIEMFWNINIVIVPWLSWHYFRSGDELGAILWILTWIFICLATIVVHMVNVSCYGQTTQKAELNTKPKTDLDCHAKQDKR